MRILIVTGLSGAGKSRATAILEDLGFFCIDNMPIDFIPKFVELCAKTSSNIANVAVVTDIRSKKNFDDDFFASLEEIKDSQTHYEILFLDANNKSLIKRYKETRRKHPLENEAKGSIDKAINLEREKLKKLKEKASYIVDTSNLTLGQLKERLSLIVFGTSDNTSMTVYINSFGFKYGTPVDSDMVLDVRCFPNPYYIDELRDKTGLDSEVFNYVMESPDVEKFMDKLYDMVVFLIPLYQREGKNSLVISIGCTGGKHRSVTIARQLTNLLLKSDFYAVLGHRDIDKR